MEGVYEYQPCLDVYLAEAQKHFKNLSEVEEIDLALRISGGDKKAEEYLVTSNLLFVATVAREYRGRGLPLADLISAGNEGLIKAARRFCPDKDSKFITYAAWWIRQTILVAIANESRNVRLPVNRIKSINALKKCRRFLAQELGRSPSESEVKVVMDQPSLLSVGELDDFSRTELSLDFPAREDSDITLLDLVPDVSIPLPEEELFKFEFMEALRKVLEELEATEIFVLELYFGLYDQDSLTLEQIGQQLDLTKERIRQIRDKALEKLRHKSRRNKLEVYYDILKTRW